VNAILVESNEQVHFSAWYAGRIRSTPRCMLVASLPSRGHSGRTDFDQAHHRQPGASGADSMKQHGSCLPSTLYPIELQVRAAMISGWQSELLRAIRAPTDEQATISGHVRYYKTPLGLPTNRGFFNRLSRSWNDCGGSTVGSGSVLRAILPSPPSSLQTYKQN
jgi:hypothetical protein